MMEVSTEVRLEDVLQAKMRQPGGLALDLTTRPDYGRRDDALAPLADLAEGVVYEREAGPSGAFRTRRRYTGESPALCAACGLHFADPTCKATHGAEGWDEGSVVDDEAGDGQTPAFVYDAITNLEQGAKEVTFYPRRCKEPETERREMDYEERLSQFELAYEAQQEALLGLNDEYPGPFMGRGPSGWHPVMIGGEQVDIEDYLVTDADYALRGDLLDEGVEMGLDPHILISYETDEMEILIRPKEK